MANCERNPEIVRRYLLPTSIVDLSKEYGLTKQRIFQIVKKANAHRPRIDMSIPGSRSGMNKAIREAITNGTRPDWRRPPGGKTLEIIALRETRPEKTYKQIGDELGVAMSTVANALKRWRPDLLRAAPP